MMLLYCTNKKRIQGVKTKHISPKFFNTHELQKNGEINVQQIQSNKNFAELLTIALLTTTSRKMVNNIGMHQFQHLDLFFRSGFYPTRFFMIRF